MLNLPKRWEYNLHVSTLRQGLARFVLTTVTLTLLAQTVWGQTSLPKCVPISSTTTGLPDSPGQYSEWVERDCVSGDKVFMNNLWAEDVRYVINLVCDLEHTVYVDGYDNRSDERNFVVICIKQ